jgi:hypothetical protein
LDHDPGFGHTVAEATYGRLIEREQRAGARIDAWMMTASAASGVAEIPRETAKN